MLEGTDFPKSWIVKSIVLKADDRFILAVLPVDGWIDLYRLKEEPGVRNLQMADESELASLFPGCEFGAIPPFGNMYGLEVWVDPEVTHNEKILFKSGSHCEAIVMLYTDFERITGPRKTALSGGKPWL